MGPLEPPSGRDISTDCFLPKKGLLHECWRSELQQIMTSCQRVCDVRMVLWWRFQTFFVLQPYACNMICMRYVKYKRR